MLDRMRRDTISAPESANRFQRIKRPLLETPIHLCLERANWITTFFRRFNTPSDPVIIQKAKALRYLLQHKSVRIYPQEDTITDLCCAPLFHIGALHASATPNLYRGNRLVIQGFFDPAQA